MEYEPRFRVIGMQSFCMPIWGADPMPIFPPRDHPHVDINMREANKNL
jgi:hypothetical protein